MLCNNDVRYWNQKNTSFWSDKMRLVRVVVTNTTLVYKIKFIQNKKLLIKFSPYRLEFIRNKLFEINVLRGLTTTLYFRPSFEFWQLFQTQFLYIKANMRMYIRTQISLKLSPSQVFTYMLRLGLLLTIRKFGREGCIGRREHKNECFAFRIKVWWLFANKRY